MTKNYSVTETGAFSNLIEQGRVMIGEKLGLTGCEISYNSYPAGQSSAFSHSHTLNEEVYIIVHGSGQFRVDQEVFPIQEGSTVRVAPAGQRALKAGNDGLVYICIQAEVNSLTQSTQDDGVISSDEFSWV